MDKKEKKRVKDMCLQAYQSGLWHESIIEANQEALQTRTQKINKAYMKYGRAKLIKNLFDNLRARICCREETANRYVVYAEYFNSEVDFCWTQRHKMRMSGIMEMPEG